MAIGIFSLTLMAVVLIAVSLGQFMALGLASGRAAIDLRKRRSADVRSLRQAVQIARLNSELQTTSTSSGIAWRVMEVAEIIDESLDCRSFYLVDPYGQTLPDFHPGQHLLVRPALAGAYQVTRCYSLSSSPNARYWRITVKRQLADDARPADAQGSRGERKGPVAAEGQQGGLSQWLFQTIGQGDCLLIGGPNGSFCLTVDNPRPLVLLAAGIGITPMVSMLRWSLEAVPDRAVSLLYQVRDTRHWPFGSNLHDWTRAAPSLRVSSFFSRASRGEVTEALKQAVPFDAAVVADSGTRSSVRLGKFNAADVVAASPGQDCDYFMCGPQDWMESLRDGLLQAGIAEARIHRELFGSPPPSSGVQRHEPVEALDVQFVASGVSAQWSSPDQSLWELAREHQVNIASGCLSGVCGGCRVKLLDGQVVYDRQPAFQLLPDECLACVARPLTPCKLDA